MMDTEILVYADLHGAPKLVGRLWAHLRRGNESATFEYDKAWLSGAERYALEPALQLGAGAFHTATDRALFGALGDSAPDRWGRMLMRRSERRRAAAAGEAPRTLYEIKHLVYRVLAETMRTKFFLRAAGADRLVSISELINLTGIDQFAGFSWIGNLLKNLEPTARVRRLIAVRAIRHRKRVDVNCKCGDC